MVLGDAIGPSIAASGMTAVAPVAQADQALSAWPWSAIALEGLAAMTQSHQWQSTEWLVARLTQIPLAERSAGGIAIATLPLAIYFHDDLNRQRHGLEQLLAAVFLEAADRTWVMAFAYAIAQAVRGQLDPPLLLPQVLAYLRVTQTTAASSPVLAALEQLATCHQAASLSGLLTQPLPAIAIALICFLQTPEDFRLALTRAARIVTARASSPEIIPLMALTGAIVGAHTSLTGIPASYQVSDALPALGYPSIAALKALAAALIASWSGLYDTRSVNLSLPVAAPWVIRP